MDSQGVTIMSKDPTVTGKFEFRFVATEPRFNFVNKSVSFSVTF